MSQQQRAFEEYARQILQRELGRVVVIHDDGRKPGMYDLRVGTEHAPDIAIECTAAVDPVRTATWNVGPAEGSLMLESTSDWYLVLKPHAQVKKARRQLREVVRLCEAAGINGRVEVDWSLKRYHPDVFAALDALRIDSIGRYDGTGTVRFGMTGIGGAVDTHGEAIPGWIEEFLRAPARKDVIDKLERSSAVQRHVFVGVDLGGVPWPVESYLGDRTDHLPERSPVLPPPIDAVWIMYGERGLHWDGQEWRFFDSRRTVPTESPAKLK